MCRWFLGAGNGLEVIKNLKSHRIDVLIFDLNMPIMDGKQLIKKMKPL
ncbi:MAG: response regulator, partial [Crocinitomicaceae bacterium]|nr:response regulator [Crocinitomicaceae bacterium]